MSALALFGAALIVSLPPPPPQLSCPEAGAVLERLERLDPELEDVPWTAWVSPPEGDDLLVEVEAQDPGVDLDLCLHLASGLHEARSHRGREQLLIPRPQGPLRVEVHGPAGAPFRLRLARLGAPRALSEGRLALDLAADRVVSVALPAAEAPRLAQLELREGDVDWRLYGVDGGLLAVGERPGGEQSWLPPAGQVVAVLMPRGPGAVRGDLVLHASPRLRSPLRDFLGELGKTPDQRQALDALAQHPDFLRIASYLEGYPGGLPIALRAKPGLEINGIERFGAYRERVLTINPTIPPHRVNVQELVDTVVHELIHAVLDLPRAPGYPFGPEVKDSLHDPRLRGYSSSSLRRGNVPPPVRAYLQTHYGPSASNPTRDFSDLNAGGQRLIVKLVRDNLRRTQVGGETLVFRNERARRARSTK